MKTSGWQQADEIRQRSASSIPIGQVLAQLSLELQPSIADIAHN